MQEKIPLKDMASIKLTTEVVVWHLKGREHIDDPQAHAETLQRLQEQKARIKNPMLVVNWVPGRVRQCLLPASSVGNC